MSAGTTDAVLGRATRVPPGVVVALVAILGVAIASRRGAAPASS